MQEFNKLVQLHDELTGNDRASVAEIGVYFYNRGGHYSPDFDFGKIDKRFTALVKIIYK